ncbi:DUF438 domain-containing protein [bacterium]|nr:DUF438 domain-containing protein [bacterium]
MEKPRFKKEFIETKEKIKNILRKLKDNENDQEVNNLKEEFKTAISKADPLVIAIAEGELAKEGFTTQYLMKACEIHMELFKDQIENPNLKVPSGHPIGEFQKDHRNILDLLEKLIEQVKIVQIKESYEEAFSELAYIQIMAGVLMDAENHNVRQENTLFPVLERHGIEEPPAIMWEEHSQMKKDKKRLLKLLEQAENMDFNEFKSQLNALSRVLLDKFAFHTQKEENILYVAALNVITPEEWEMIKEECNNLGYFNPEIDKERS